MTKQNDVLLSAGDLGEAYDGRSWRCATAAPPASVEILVDLFGEEVSEPLLAYQPPCAPATDPTPTTWPVAAAIAAAAERPVLYGPGVHYAGARAELRQLAEAWSIPVTTSIEGKSAFPDTWPPLALGTAGRLMPTAVRSFSTGRISSSAWGPGFTCTGFGAAMPKGAGAGALHRRPGRSAKGLAHRARPDRRRAADPAGPAGRAGRRPSAGADARRRGRGRDRRCTPSSRPRGRCAWSPRRRPSIRTG
ncbi:MAG: hypothetical protein R2749_28880 [Acidimicrobiales bacterium]